MLKIYLARHGQDQDNASGILNGRRDTPLTELGKEQAHILAEKIKESNLEFNKIYSSPLKRAYATAEIIADTISGPLPVAIEDLIERDFGIMTGRLTSSIVEYCSPDIIQGEVITYFLKPQGAETFPDLLTRGRRLLNYIQNQHSEGSILLVTHGDMGKMIYAAYYNLNWKDVLTQFHFGNSELLILSNNSSAQEAHVFRQQQYNH